MGGAGIQILTYRTHTFWGNQNSHGQRIQTEDMGSCQNWKEEITCERINSVCLR